MELLTHFKKYYQLNPMMWRRTKVYETIVKGNNNFECGVPDLNVLVVKLSSWTKHRTKISYGKKLSKVLKIKILPKKIILIV